MTDSVRNSRPVLLHLATDPIVLWWYFNGQIRFMSQAGLDVRAISSAGPWLTRFAAREQVQVDTVPMSRQVTPFGDLRVISRLIRKFKEHRPDILVAHQTKAGLLGMIAATLAGVPVRVYQNHGLALLTARGLRRIVLFSCEWLACRLAHRILCVSPSTRSEYLRLGLADPVKIRVIGQGSANGVDAINLFNSETLAGPGKALRERLGIGSSDVVLGFLGRISLEKGVHELLSSWAKIRDRYPQTHLLVGGPLDADDSATRELVRIAQTDRRCHWMGYVEDSGAFFAATDIFVFPSHREGIGSVLLEASAMAVPTIGNRLPGVVDAIVDQVTGTLVPKRDVKALVAAIERYIEQPALRREHGEAGRQRMLRDFRPERIWEGLLAEYRELLDSQVSSPSGAGRA